MPDILPTAENGKTLRAADGRWVAEDAEAVAVADIADTSTATAEDVGNKVNELLAALRAVGLVAE